MHTTNDICRVWTTRKVYVKVGTKFTSETFWQLSIKLNIQKSLTSSYHHKSSGQVEVCIKFVKCTIRKFINTNQDINLALLQICSTPVSVGLSSLVAMLFNRPVRGLYHK